MEYDKPDETLCGDKLPPRMRSYGPRMLLVFSSGQTQEVGFKLNYKFETGQCSVPYCFISHFINLLFQKFATLSLSSSSLMERAFLSSLLLLLVSRHRGRVVCVTEFQIPGTAAPDGSCTFTYVSTSQTSGEFNSPRHPSNYPSNTTCTYIFEVSVLISSTNVCTLLTNYHVLLFRFNQSSFISKYCCYGDIQLRHNCSFG